MLFPEGGQQVETTPQGDDMGSCPSVSASICQAEVAQLHILCFVADTALLPSTSGRQNPSENRIHPRRSMKYCISGSFWLHDI